DPLGILAEDTAGFPNGRRLADDVVDIALRVVAGATPFTPDFNVAPNTALSDGVDANDKPFLDEFPYVAAPTAYDELGAGAPAAEEEESEATPEAEATEEADNANADVEVADDDDDDTGTIVTIVILAVAGVAVVAGGSYLFMRNRA
ncbi:MAG TPA: DUF4331 family protein, partial [Dehalococcoidia bacterium]|nr:DUF4331 family protein [Dehalococcoidia bacterium]